MIRQLIILTTLCFSLHAAYAHFPASFSDTHPSACSEDAFEIFKNFPQHNFGTGKPPKDPLIVDITGMEERLNKRVLQQTGAVKSVVISLFNYVAGIKESNRPIGVFLFLGPSGVGKTELAKVLADEVYKDPTRLLRFDMSLFSEPHSVAKLVGSPPGYVNHEEGGQLTEPLSLNSQVIVLFDEIEKAHPQVAKAFLSVFDEGFIVDNKNRRIGCTDTIFIMTSNLCSKEITTLYNQGYGEDEILLTIEPKLMEALSPELYNRVQAIVFEPLAPETMEALVNMLLNQLKARVLKDKGIRITIDPSLTKYLIENGYHPLLGARPLKKLIDKKVIAALSYSIVVDKIANGASITLVYDEGSDSVVIVR